MRYTFIADLHKFAPHALNIDVPLDPAIIEQENIWLLGDIVDLKGCDPKDKEECLKYFELLCRTYGERYIKGNHDGESTDILVRSLDDDTLGAHGDVICWSFEKAMAFRSMPKFQGYGWIKSFINWARHLWKQRISNFEEKQGVNYCERARKKTIVYGHSHTTKVLIKMTQNKKLVNIPRGITVINL